MVNRDWIGGTSHSKKRVHFQASVGADGQDEVVCGAGADRNGHENQNRPLPRRNRCRSEDPEGAQPKRDTEIA